MAESSSEHFEPLHDERMLIYHHVQALADVMEFLCLLLNDAYLQLLSQLEPGSSDSVTC